MADGPLVLLLLNALVTVIKKLDILSCTLVWAPFQLYFLVSSSIVYHDAFQDTGRHESKAVVQRRRLPYVILAFPRWILSTIAYPLVIGFWVAGVWASMYFAAGESRLIIIVVAISTAFFLGRALRSGYFIFNVGPTPRVNFDRFGSAVVSSQIDMLAFFAWLLSFMGVVRTFAAARLASRFFTGESARAADVLAGDQDQTENFQQASCTEFLRTICDWLCLLPFALMCVLPWRMRALLIASRDPTLSYRTLRYTLLVQAMHTLLDLPFFLLTLPVALFIYRIPDLATDLWRADYNDRRRVCTFHFVELIFDLPALLAGLVVTITIYRAPAFWSLVIKGPSALVRREHATYFLLFVLADLASAFMFLLLLLPTVYRVPKTLALIRTRRVARSSYISTLPEPHRTRWVMHPEDITFGVLYAVSDQTARLLLDMPGWLAGASVLITFWRIPALVFEWRRPENADIDHKAGCCWRAFHLWLFDLPFVPLFLLPTLSVWRTLPFLYQVYLAGWWVDHQAKVTTAADEPHPVRALCVAHSLRVLMDVPSFCELVLLVLTVYRVPSVLAQLRHVPTAAEKKAKVKESTEAATTASASATASAPSSSSSSSPASSSSSLFTLATAVEPSSSPALRYHVVLFHQFSQLLLDLPFMVFAVIGTLCVWRAPTLWRGFFQKDNADARRRWVAACTFLGLLDIPAFVGLTIVLCTVWRAFFLTRGLRSWAEKLPAERKPASGATTLGVMTLLRLCCVDATILQNLHLWRWSTSWQRVAILELIQLLYPQELLAMALVPLCLWRLPSLARFLASSRWRSSQDRRLGVLTFFSLMICDVLALLGSALVIVTLWRARTLIRELRKERFDRKSEEKKRQERVGVTHPEAVAPATSSASSFSSSSSSSSSATTTADAKPATAVNASATAATAEEKRPLLTRAASSRLTRAAASEKEIDYRQLRLEFRIHKIVATQVVLFIRDLPLIAMTLVACLAFWRIPRLIRAFREKSEFGDQFGAASSEASSGFLDILCALLCVVLLPSWRGPLVFRRLKAEWANRKSQKNTAASTASDAPAATAARASAASEEVKSAASSASSSASASDTSVSTEDANAAQLRRLTREKSKPTTDPSSLPAQPPPLQRPKSTKARKPSRPPSKDAKDDDAKAEPTELPIHKFIISQTVQLLLDIPFILLSPLTLWRLPGVIGAAFAAPFRSLTPVVGLKKVQCAFPTEKTLTGSGTMDGHGFFVTLVGVKPADWSFKYAYLRIVNESFWSALAQVAPASAVSAFRMTMHPVSLCPTMLSPAEFPASSTEFEATLEIGTGKRKCAKISHTPLIGGLKQLVSKGDAWCVCRVECVATTGEKGVLCNLAFKPSDLLAAHERNTPQPLAYLDSASVALSDSSTSLPPTDLFKPALDASTTNHSASGLRVMVVHQIAMVLLDLLSLLAVVITSLIPWRFVRVWKAALGDISNLHSVALTEFSAAARALPLELLALSLCTVLVWNLTRVLKVLFAMTDEDVKPQEAAPAPAANTAAATASARVRVGGARSSALAREALAKVKRLSPRTTKLWKLVAKCWLELMILTLLLVEVLTIWRLPFLLLDLYLLFSSMRKTRHGSVGVFFHPVIKDAILMVGVPKFAVEYNERAKQPSAASASASAPDAPEVPPFKVMKLRVGAVIVKQFFLFVLDLVQLLEVVYVLFTLVQIPELFQRSALLASYTYSRRDERNRQAQLARHKAEGKLEGAREIQFLDVLPHESALFPFLGYKELAACATVRHAWSVEARKDRYWRTLFQKRWPLDRASLLAKAVTNDFAALYRAKHMQESNVQHVPPPQHETDYAQGARFMIHDVFLRAIANFPHFLLLPLKVLGIMSLPIYGYGYIRFNFIFSFDHRISDEQARRCLTLSANHLSFKSLHWFFFSNLRLLLLMILNDLGLLLMLVNVLVMVVITAGGPLWYLAARAIDYALPLNLVADAFMLLVFPFFCIIQLYIIFLPNLVWWSSYLGWAWSFFSLIYSLFAFLIGFIFSIISGIFYVCYWLFALLSGPEVIAEFAPLFSWLSSLFSASLVPVLSSVVDVHALGQLVLGAFHSLSTLITSTVSTWGSLLSASSSAAAAIDPASVSLVVLFPIRGLNIALLQSVIEWFVMPFDLVLRFQLWLAQSFYMTQLPSLVGTLLSWGLWLLLNRVTFQFFWFALYACSWDVPMQHIIVTLFPAANPLWVATFPFRLVRRLLSAVLEFCRQLLQTLRACVRKIMEMQNRTLGAFTQLCASMGLIGDLLLIPVAFGWMGWPVVAVYLRGARPLYFLATVLSLSLVVRGRAVIAANWKK